MLAEIEDELRLAAGLTALREQAGLSQRELAKRIGISQPRVAAIEQSRNVTIDVLEQYVAAVGGQLEVSVVKGNRKTPLIHREFVKRQGRRAVNPRLSHEPRRSRPDLRSDWLAVRWLSVMCGHGRPLARTSVRRSVRTFCVQPPRYADRRQLSHVHRR